MRIRLKYIAILLAIICIAITVLFSDPYNINLNGLIDNLTPNVLLALFLGVVLQFAGHYLRAVKHSLLLNRVRPVKTYEVFKGQSIGYLFNFILPFRIGELIRAHYIARGVSISRSAVFATIIFERFIDLAVLLTLVIPLVILAFEGKGSSSIIPISIFLLVSLGIAGFVLYSARTQQAWLLRVVYHLSSLFNNSIKNRIRLMSWSAIYILKNAIDRKNIYTYLYLTITMWAAYLASTAVLAWALLPSFSSATRWVVTEAAYVGISVPSGPAYLTTFRQIFTDLSGLSATYLHENSITLLVWSLLIIPISVVGLILLFVPQKKYSNKQSDIVTALKNKLYRDVDITEDFAHFLDAYFKGVKINKILTSEELSNNFKVIRTFRGGSGALTLLAWQDEKMIVKKITLKQYQDKLKAQYDWLKGYAQFDEITDVIGERSNDVHYSIDIEYKEEFIPFFDTIHSSSSVQNSKILRNVLSFMNTSIYAHPEKAKQNPKLAKQYIKTKAVEKIVDSSNINTHISQLASYETIVINNEEFDNFFQIIDKILLNKEIMKDISAIEKSDIHGDLTVDNIIVNPKNNKFIILDPNNENAISDKVVDLGKMMQSLHSGYEFLVLLSTCDIRGNAISFKESKSHRYEELYEELMAAMEADLSDPRFRSVLFHEAVHYCRMLPYRCDINPKTAPVFYAIAVRLFNEFYRQYEK